MPLDERTRRSQNDLVRKAAVLILVLLTGQTILPATCIGWESDPAARKACCKRAHHDHCGNQAAADDCCASHEGASVGTLAAGVMNVAAIPDVSPAAALAFTIVPPLDSRSRLVAYLTHPHAPS